jgi:hypothetical protein
VLRNLLFTIGDSPFDRSDWRTPRRSNFVIFPFLDKTQIHNVLFLSAKYTHPPTELEARYATAMPVRGTQPILHFLNIDGRSCSCPLSTMLVERVMRNFEGIVTTARSVVEPVDRVVTSVAA